MVVGMTQRYMSVRELAAYLGVSEASVRQRVQRRNIPFIKDGKSVRFDKEDVDRHQASKKVVRVTPRRRPEDV